MKVKVNRRFIQIATISFIIAISLTIFAYSSVKKTVEPEEKIMIAYFKKNLNSDTEINNPQDYLKYKATPISLVPQNAIRDFKQVEGKRLIINASAGDFALTDNFRARGDITVDVDEMYQISLEIDSISNFLGTQIKQGNYYGLIYVNGSGKAQKIYKVKAVDIIDATGKAIAGESMTSIKALNIAVHTIDELKSIAENKRSGSFELVNMPDGYWD